MGELKMGKSHEMWMHDRDILYVTMGVTEECNLRCTYCYYTHKNPKKMKYETAKKVIDYVLKDDRFASKEGILIEFIGGEPTLEINLISQICDYFIQQAYIIKPQWFVNHRFMIGTNGLLYDTPEMQKFIKKHFGHLVVNMSIDGTKIKHDMSRKKKDGRGSYDDVEKVIPLWREQFPYSSTKATFSHDDLPYLKDSIIHLWSLGLDIVPANIVFEDVWQDGDDIIYEEQLKGLADYIIENKLWEEYSVTLFDPSYGLPVSLCDNDYNACGVGNSFAVDCEGRFTPCHRFFKFGLDGNPGVYIGDVDHGIDDNKLRPFYALNQKTVNSAECNSCEVAEGCGYCTAYNYIASKAQTIFYRATFKCSMHKVLSRVNQYLWRKIADVTGGVSNHEMIRISKAGLNTKYMYFILSNKFPTHCILPQKVVESEERMSGSTFDKGLEFAKKYNYIPVFLCDTGVIDKKECIRVNKLQENSESEGYNISVIDSEKFNEKNIHGFLENVIFRINRFDIKKCQVISKLFLNIRIG